MRELNRIIDNKIPYTRPQFRREEIVLAGEAFEVYIRDIVECIKSLFGDPEFAPYLLLRPEHHFMDLTKQENAYSDMNTGTWWWEMQVWFAYHVRNIHGTYLIDYSKRLNQQNLALLLFPSLSRPTKHNLHCSETSVPTLCT